MSSSKLLQVCVVGDCGGGGGKSLLCNRFVRPAYDQFHTEHCSVLSQTDFCGSPVINNEHWLYWGERLITNDDGTNVNVRLIEQTEFLDDETYEVIAGPSKEDYCKRACKTSLQSRDKLMYIQKEQLGLEADFDQKVLPDGKFNVDAFVLVCSVAKYRQDLLEKQSVFLQHLLSSLSKTKKPVIVAFTKCDVIHEDTKKHFLNLIGRKELKNVHLPPIEVSSIYDVNVVELFTYVASVALKLKSKRKTAHAYYEAARAIEDRNLDVRKSYMGLLAKAIPSQTWPNQGYSWHRMMADLDRHPDFLSFVHVFGITAAHQIYERFICDAKENWMSARLKLQLPHLGRAFATLFEKSNVVQMTWHEARDAIYSHPLFDEFFQPIGSLGKRLEYSDASDSRLPAEILLLKDANDVFEGFQKNVAALHRKEKLEDDFHRLLTETNQVTPGKPLKDVCLFLQGCAPFDCLSPAQAAMVYDRYQTDLIKKAETEFVECLLENVEMFVDVIQQAPDDLAAHFHVFKDFLEQDRRYRHLSRLFDLRDSMISEMCSFYRLPSTTRCPAASRCTELVVADALQAFFQRRNDVAYTHLIDVVVHGDTALVAQFITELNAFLHNKPFQFSCGSAFMRTFGAEETVEKRYDHTNVFLIDSIATLEQVRSRNLKEEDVPPVVVVVCDPSNYDNIPMLQQQAAQLVVEVGGTFFGVGTYGSNSMDDTTVYSYHTDSSSLLSRDQLLGISESICSAQMTRRRNTWKVQVSLMCGDIFSLDALIANIFGDIQQVAVFRPIVHQNLLRGGIVPVDVVLPVADQTRASRKARVDFSFRSYHSWISPSFVRPNQPHGHVLVYSTRRTASFCHFRAGIAKFVETTRDDLSGRLVIIAIADQQEDQTKNPLWIEGRELAASVGARFVTVSSTETQLTKLFVDLVNNLQMIIPSTSAQEFQEVYPRSNGQGYEPNKSAMSLELKNPLTDVVKKEKKAKKMSRPNALRLFRSDQKSISGPVVLTQFRQAEFQVAPLATPEMVEIAPEYSLIDDVNDEHIYETLDFRSKKVPSISAPKEDEDNDSSYQSLRPSRNGSAYSSPEPSRLHRTHHLHPTSSSQHSLSPVMTRSVTVAVLNATPTSTISSTESECRGRIRRPSVTAPIVTVRASLSAESLVKEKKTKRRDFSQNRFVRKVATSFRFKKDKLEEVRKEEMQSEERLDEKPKKVDKKASRSLPQSPHVNRKKISINSSEKLASALSWLPTRSPKKSHKSATTDVSIPSSRFSKKLKLTTSISASSSSSSSSQGVVGPTDTLEGLCKDGNAGIPIFVEKCVQIIEKTGGLDLEGLYRVPGNQAHLADVERGFRETGELDLSSVDVPIHVTATALKNFFSCLPGPLLPTTSLSEIGRCVKQTDPDKRLQAYKNYLATVPLCNRVLLKYLVHHLVKVSHSPKTAMDLKNLSKVWFPTIFRPSFDSYEELSTGTALYQQALEYIFNNSSFLFNF